MERQSRNTFMFSWIIEKFRFMDKRETLNSPVFSVDFIRGSKWYLSIDYDDKGTDEVGLFLYRCNDDYTSSIFLNYDFTIITGGNVIKTRSIKNHEFIINSVEGFGFQKMIKHCEIFPEERPLISDNDLLIECGIWMCENESSKSAQLPHFVDCFDRNFNSRCEFPSEHFCNLKDMVEIREKIFQSNSLCRARNMIDVDETELFWTIERFSALQKNEKKIIFAESSFSAEHCAVILLYLTDDDMIQIDVLVNKNLSDKYVSLHCQVGVCDVYDNIEIKSTKMCYFATGIRQNLSLQRLISKSDILSSKERLLEDDNLNLHFVLIFVSKPSTSRRVYSTTSKNRVLKSEAKNNPISMQMENLFVFRKHCDVTLKAQDQDIQAHKAVLCSMSPVLDAMFDADMKEKNTGIVHVTDVGPDTLRTLVRYMYTRHVGEMNVEKCFDLFAASDKYQVSSLKNECRRWFKSTLTIDNVCDVLTCAYTHTDDRLKTYAMEFVCRNVSMVFASDKFTSLVENDPQLAREVILYVTTKLRKK